MFLFIPKEILISFTEKPKHTECFAGKIFGGVQI